MDRWLASQLPDPVDRAVFEAQEARVETPFVYDWYSGQFSAIQVIQDTFLGVCLLLGIALAPLFAGEVQTGTLAISHAARRGRGRLAVAKLGAALTVAVAVWALVAGLLVVCQRLAFGTRGLDCPIQLMKPLATAPLTFGDCQHYALVFGLACCLGTVGFTAVFSALAPANFPAILAVQPVCLILLAPLAGWLYTRRQVR